MSRIGRLPVTVPSGVDVTIDGQARQGQGPQGLAQRTRSPSRSPSTQRRGRRSRSSAPTTSASSRSLHGLTRSLINNMVVGVTEGYEKKLEIHGTGYRVPAKGSQPRVLARLQPPDHRRGPRGHHLRRREPDPVLGRRASTSSRSARSPPTSASCASPTRTRARACGTRASRSAARSERLVSKPWQ